MPDTPARLGDIIDDYCSRCSLIMNHAVLGLVAGEVKRVRCNTCMNEHAYRRARVPRKKKDSVQDLFDQVLSRIPDPPSDASPPARPARRRTPHLSARSRQPPEPEVKPPAPGKRGGRRRRGRS